MCNEHNIYNIYNIHASYDSYVYLHLKILHGTHAQLQQPKIIIKFLNKLINSFLSGDWYLCI